MTHPLLSPIASAASRELSVRHGHVMEVLAALLGYNTYAALRHEEKDPLVLHLAQAHVIVLNVPAGEMRASALHLEDPEATAGVCVRLFIELCPQPTYTSVRAMCGKDVPNDDFWATRGKWHGYPKAGRAGLITS